MAVTDDRRRLKNRRRKANLDQHNRRRSYRYRRRSVHGDAEGTVVGSSRVGVGVRYLDDGQKSQQNEAQYRNDRPGI